MPSDATLSEWLTVREVALRLRLARMTVYRLCETGALRSYRVGRQIRITTADYEAYLAAARQS